MTPVPRLDVRMRNYRGTLLLARAEQSLELTDVAAFVWRLLDGQRSLEDVAKAVATEYAIDYDTAYTDCSELVEALADAGMLDVTA
jgi:pyrroloquinoline quinone biosynthesis protein D